MATRQTEVDRLVQRCKGAGWAITRDDEYITVKPLRGRPLTLHRTLGSASALRNAEARLRKAGLEEDEKAAAAAREQRKAERLAEGERVVKVRTRTALQRSRAAAKAAGPYAGPQEMPLDWFVTAHPAPAAQFVLMTPELAAKILDNCNTHNRRQRNWRIDTLTGEIDTKNWILIHQGVAFDTHGRVLDGQHRLVAIARGEATVPLLACVGMDPRGFAVIDTAMPRKTRDLLDIEGEKSTTVLESTIRMVRTYREKIRGRRRLYTNRTLLEGFHDDPDLYREAVHWGTRQYQETLIPPTQAAAAHALVHAVAGAGNPFAGAYFTGLAAGHKPDRMMLPPVDPRARILGYAKSLRRGGRKRPSPLDMVGVIIRGWNYVLGETTASPVRIGHDLPHPLPPPPAGSTPPPWLVGELELEGEP